MRWVRDETRVRAVEMRSISGDNLVAGADASRLLVAEVSGDACLVEVILGQAVARLGLGARLLLARHGL